MPTNEDNSMCFCFRTLSKFKKENRHFFFFFLIQGIEIRKQKKKTIENWIYNRISFIKISFISVFQPALF